MQITALHNSKQNYPDKIPVKGHSCSCERGSLDTLVQIRKSNSEPLETLRKRANAKAMNYPILGALMDLKSELYDHYRKATSCCDKIDQSDGKLTSRYCNSRACMVCNRIRTAKLLNAYSPLFKHLKNPYFLTLTKPTVVADKLRDGIGETVKQFSKINDVLRKRGIKIDCLRKLECTYSKGRFHAHLHLIVEGKEIAEMILAEWMKRNPTSSSQGQCLKKANKETLSELFKYVAKPPIKKDGTLNAWALDRILCAMYRKRTLQPYGLFRSKPVTEDVTPEDATLIVEDQDYDLYVWHQPTLDWISTETGLTLSGHQPTEKLLQFLTLNKSTHEKGIYSEHPT